MQGWIKLHRKIVDWEWYDDLPTFKLFIHLLILANHEDNVWHGQIVKRGSLVTSISSLAHQTGLTNQNVRTCLAHLQKTGEISKQSTNKNTLIIMLNYERYQELSADEDVKINNQLTSSQQTTNKQANNQLTTNKNDKKIKNDKNDKEREKAAVFEAKEFEVPSLSEVQNFVVCEKLKCSAEDFFDYYSANGWMVGQTPMRNWKAMCRKWSRSEKQKPTEKIKSAPSYDLEKIKSDAMNNTEI